MKQISLTNTQWQKPTVPPCSPSTHRRKDPSHTPMLFRVLRTASNTATPHKPLYWRSPVPPRRPHTPSSGAVREDAARRSLPSLHPTPRAQVAAAGPDKSSAPRVGCGRVGSGRARRRGGAAGRTEAVSPPRVRGAGRCPGRGPARLPASPRRWAAARRGTAPRRARWTPPSWCSRCRSKRRGRSSSAAPPRSASGPPFYAPVPRSAAAAAAPHPAAAARKKGNARGSPAPGPTGRRRVDAAAARPNQPPRASDNSHRPLHQPPARPPTRRRACAPPPAPAHNRLASARPGETGGAGAAAAAAEAAASEPEGGRGCDPRPGCGGRR